MNGTNLSRSVRGVEVRSCWSLPARYCSSSVCRSSVSDCARASSCPLHTWACFTADVMNLSNAKAGSRSSTGVRDKNSCATSMIVSKMMDWFQREMPVRPLSACPNKWSLMLLGDCTELKQQKKASEAEILCQCCPGDTPDKSPTLHTEVRHSGWCAARSITSPHISECLERTYSGILVSDTDTLILIQTPL